MTDTKNIILNHSSSVAKNKKNCLSNLESNSNEKEVVIAGIVGNGLLFAKKLVVILTKYQTLKATLCEVINKKNPLDPFNYFRMKKIIRTNHCFGR